MKEQTEIIRQQLMAAIKGEIMRLLADGKMQRDIAKIAGTNPPFISNFINDNEAGMNGLSITKLIAMANGLGLRLKLEIKRIA